MSITQLDPDPKQFAQFIKALRESRKLSAGDVQELRGYLREQTAPVYRWESGKHKTIPGPKLIIELGAVLKLSTADITQLLGLAGHLPETMLPPQKYVLQVLDMVAQQIQDYPLPAYVLDFRGNYWVVNPAAMSFFSYKSDVIAKMMESRVNVFDFIFNHALGFSDQVQGIDSLQRDQVFRFKMTNLFRQHERFYKNMLPIMKTRLQTTDYEHFIEILTTVDPQTTEVTGWHGQRGIIATIDHTYPQFNNLQWSLTVQPIFSLQTMFDLVQFHLPPEQHAHVIIAQASSPPTGEPVCLWKFTDVDDLGPWHEGKLRVHKSIESRA